MNRYETYKDSGISWLGEVPDHWEVKRLKFLARIQNGADYKHVETNDGYPVIGSGGQFAYANSYLYDGESVLLGRKGTIDKPLYVNGKFWTVDTMYYTEILKNTYPKYLYYLTLTIDFGRYSTQTALPSMTQTALNNLVFAVPHYKEQTAIAHYLDAKLGEIDALIGKQQTLLEKLAEQRTAVITHAVTKGLNPAAPMKKSGVEWLGDVPAHWNVSYLKFYYEVQLGKMLQPKSNNTDDFEISYFKAFHVQWNNIMTEELPLMWVNPSELDKYTVNNGDLLICEGGEVGRCSILRNLDGIAIIQNAVHRVRTLKNSEIRYLDYVIRHIASVGWFNILCNKATIAHLTSEKLINLNIPIPPKDEQINIADYLDQETAKIDRLCDTVNQTIGRLKEYRTALITQAVTGKIKVTNE